MISYNQEKYIIDALHSVLSQKTNFDYHVFLSDDCSTDDTQNRVEEFLNNHPKKNMVSFIKQSKNLGWMPNFIFTLQKCIDSGAKYIAMCEGDDFWINKNKLQKQIDILESNPDVNLACHQYKELYNDGSEIECPYFRRDFFQNKSFFKFTQRDFEEFMRIQTMTMVLRSSSIDLNLSRKYAYYCDTHIKHHVLDRGKGYYTKDVDAVYRIHGSNVFMSLNDRKKDEFSYNVYKDLIHNGGGDYKNLMNVSMRTRIANELKNKKYNFFDIYYHKLLVQQYKDTKSILLFMKNQVKGFFNL